MGFVHVPPTTLAEVARSLRIIQHETGLLSEWRPNEEQLQIWEDLWRYRQAYILKVRQIGASTAICLDDLLWVAANDAAGERVRCGIVVDTEPKARERVRVCADFAKQLGINYTYNVGPNTILFENGSEIIGMTAGGRRAGASMTFHRFHFTELPFWRDPSASYTSLMQCLVLGGRVVIETTMGVDDPTAKKLWQQPNDYFKRFFSFEEHAEYRMQYDKRVLDDDMKEYLLEEGFSNIESMTYWAWLLYNRCAGDIVRCFREYPQRPEHSWMYAEGRWVRSTPKVIEPKRTSVVEYCADRATLNIYRDRSEGSGTYIVGVDTAAGLGQDRSAVVVIDCRSRQIMAEMVDADIKIDDLVQVALWAREIYSWSEVDAIGRRVNHEPSIIIESNGIGQGTVQAAAAHGIPHVPWSTGKVSRYDGLLYSKRFIEAGNVWGPAALAEECDDLRVEGGKFKGKKDLLMAMGFCYTYLASNPGYVTGVEGQAPEGFVDMNAELEKYQRRLRRF